MISEARPQPRPKSRESTRQEQVNSRNLSLLQPSPPITHLYLLTTVSQLLKRLRIFSAVLRSIMASTPNGYPNTNGATTHTLTALNRWSVANKQLPGRNYVAAPSDA